MALAAVVVVGILLRLRALTFDRSLWMDESLLALNLLRRGFLGLLQPLDHEQTAPLGFLWLAESASRVLGFSEWVLRLPAFLGGVLALLAMALLARAALASRAGQLLAIAAAALSTTGIYFSNELKPYSWDMAAGAVITWLGIWSMQRPEPRRIQLLGLGMCLSLLISSAAVFASAGVLMVLAVLLTGGRRWGALGWLGLAAVLSATVFGLHYLVVLRHAAAEKELFTYWARTFPPPPWTARGLGWLVREAPWLAGEVLGLARPTPVLLAMGVGSAYLAWRRPWVLALLVVPMALVYAAGVARQYPLYPRMLMVLAPAGYLLLGAALSMLAHLPASRSALAHLAAVVVGALLLFDTALTATIDVLAPPGREELRDVLQTLTGSAEPGDCFYVVAEARFAYEFYAVTRPELDLSRIGPVTIDLQQQRAPEGLAREMAQRLQGGRAWILYTHMVYRPGEVEDGVREALRGHFAELGKIEAPGALAEGWSPAPARQFSPALE